MPARSAELVAVRAQCFGLFARQGIRGTTLDQVEAASGTGRGQLYRFFAGKADEDVTARAVLAAGFARWWTALADGLRRVEERGELAPGTDSEAVAAALLAVYEGGVLLADVAGDLEVLRLALDALAATALVPDVVA